MATETFPDTARSPGHPHHHRAGAGRGITESRKPDLSEALVIFLLSLISKDPGADYKCGFRSHGNLSSDVVGCLVVELHTQFLCPHWSPHLLVLAPQAASFHCADTNGSAVTWEWSQRIDPPKNNAATIKRSFFKSGL